MSEKHNGLKTLNNKGVGPKDVVLIAGLGNPGKEYENTYHNAGLLGLHYLAGNADFVTASTGTFSFFKNDGKIFIQPLVFMNESGIAIRDALKYFSVKPEHMLVIQDDADIPIGELKIQFGRGEAGHHGIESIVKQIGTKEFWRARVGIEQKTFFTKRRIRAEKYVLKPLSQNHKKHFENAFDVIKKELI